MNVRRKGWNDEWSLKERQIDGYKAISGSYSTKDGKVRGTVEGYRVTESVVTTTGGADG